MQSADSVKAMDNDEISLPELFTILWRERWLILTVTLVCAIAAGVAAWVQPRQYKAIVTISPVTHNQSNSPLGGLASQFGGLASLAGLSMGEDSDKAEAMAVLQSKKLTGRYISDNNMLPVLFAKRWDASAKQWKSGRGHDPTLWEANEMFESIRTVLEDKKTGLATLTIFWTDPIIAARWANDLVRATNDYLRQKAIRDSEQHIEFLKQEAMNTEIAQIRAAIYSVLESEIRNVMLAKGPGDYALKVIDPAVVAERPSSPKRTLWVLVGAFCGVLLSLLIVFVRTTWVRDEGVGKT